MPVRRECPVCGAALSDGAQFCVHCGMALPVEPAGVGGPFEPDTPVDTLLALAEPEPDSGADDASPESFGLSDGRKGLLGRAFGWVPRILGKRSASKWSYAADATQNLINFEKMHDDDRGICRLAESTYSCAIGFDDMNYLAADDNDRMGMIADYADFLNTLTEDVSVQLWFSSTSITRERLMKLVNFKDVEGDYLGNELRHEFNRLVLSKIGKGTVSLYKRRAIIFTTEAPDHDSAYSKLDPYIANARSFFKKMDVSCHVLEGDERLELAAQMTLPDDKSGLVTLAEEDPTFHISARDLIAPSYVARLEGADLRVGDRYVRCYRIDQYGRTTKESLIPQILNLSCDTFVTIHFRPWSIEDTVAYAEEVDYSTKMEINLYRRQHTDMSQGRFVTDDEIPEELKSAREQAIRLYDEVTKNEQRMCSMQTAIILYAKSREELARAHRELQNICNAKKTRLVWQFEEDRMPLWSSSLPFGDINHVTSEGHARAMLGPNRRLLSDNLANIVPFSASNILDENGYYLGINDDTHDLILYDWAKHDTPNSLILGMPRSGKSFGVKSLITQTVLRDSSGNTFVLDPENEYGGVGRSHGGSEVLISEGSRDYINIFDLNINYSSEQDGDADPLAMKIPFIQSVISMMVKDPTMPRELQKGTSQDERILVDMVCHDIYKPYLRTLDPVALPTLKTFCDRLRDMGDEPVAIGLYKKLYQFVDGNNHMFSHATNVDLDSRLVVFNISRLSDQMRGIALLVILDQIWNKITANRSAGRVTRVFVDELQLVVSDEGALDFFNRLWSRSGKWGALITGITQQVETLLAEQQTRTMLANSHLTVMYKQNPAVIPQLKELYGLSEAQAEILEKPEPGEGLYFFGVGQAVHFVNKIAEKDSPKLYNLYTTRFTDTSAYKQRRKADAEV